MNLYELITKKFPVQYVYSYPTTRLYGATDNFLLDQVEFGDDINIYIHIPFCNQKCSFCGYLTVIEKDEKSRDQYVDALIKEIILFASYGSGKKVRSINFGGGTPSLLSNQQVEKIMNTLLSSFPDLHQTVTEISMEATPESITCTQLEHLHALGFNRISIGIQTLDHQEIDSVKRHNFSHTSLRAIEVVRQVKIPNLCLDLMYGLPSQTNESWTATVKEIIHYLPETIELYRTVIIPKTGLAKLNDPSIQKDWEQKHQWYEIARNLLLQAGYIQQSHVRFVIPGKGFYDQQQNVFAGQSLVGFGVGARSYAKNMHYRNVYSSMNSKKALREYVDRIDQEISPVQSMIILNQEELMRRYIIYNLESLDIDFIKRSYQVDLYSLYGDEIETLIELGIFERKGITLNLTEKGWYYRDTVAYVFFSEKSMQHEKEYYGAFLKDW